MGGTYVKDIRGTIPSRNIERFRQCAHELADTARGMLLGFRASGFEVQCKSDGSYVTSADFKIEERLRALIEEKFPAHGIIGEEFPARLPEADFQWIFDPVDGTEDFVQRIPLFGTIIGLHFRGEPLVGVIDMPVLNIRAHAAFNLGAFHNQERLRLADLDADIAPAQIRLMLTARANFVRHQDDGALFDALTRHCPNHRIYRTCYAHLCAATGQVDATVDYGNRLWDIAASRILVEEAGGAYRLTQQLPTKTGPVFGSVFGKPAAVTALVSILDNVGR